MSKSDELWREFQCDGWIGPSAFKAALHEYGQAVRDRDAEIAHNVSPNGMEIGGADSPLTVFKKTREGCAMAINNELMP